MLKAYQQGKGRGNEVLLGKVIKVEAGKRSVGGDECVDVEGGEPRAGDNEVLGRVSPWEGRLRPRKEKVGAAGTSGKGSRGRGRTPKTMRQNKYANFDTLAMKPFHLPTGATSGAQNEVHVQRPVVEEGIGNGPSDCLWDVLPQANFATRGTRKT